MKQPLFVFFAVRNYAGTLITLALKHRLYHWFRWLGVPASPYVPNPFNEVSLGKLITFEI